MAAITRPEEAGASVPTTAPKVVVTPPTIGTILDNAMSDVEKAMHVAASKADARGKSTVGMDAFLAISNLKASYTIENLNTPLESTGKEIQTNIEKVQDVVRTLTTGEPSELAQLATKVAALEFSNPNLEAVTNVTGISPSFIAVGVNPADPSKPHITKVMVAVSGKFPLGDKAGYATLSLGGKDFPSTARSTKESLKFEVEIPSNIPTLDKRRCTFLNATLKVSYPGTGIWSYLANQKATHQILLGMERTSPGAIKVLCVTPATTLHRTQTTPPFSINSTDRVNYFKGEEGWKIVSQKVVFDQPPKPEDFVKSEIVQGNQVEYRFIDSPTTARIVTEETQEVPEKQTSIETDDTLQWGGKVVFKPKEGEKIKEAFLIDENGNVSELPLDGHHPLVHLTSKKDGSLEVTATAAEVLNAPVVMAPQTVPTSADSDTKEASVITVTTVTTLVETSVVVGPQPASEPVSEPASTPSDEDTAVIAS